MRARDIPMDELCAILEANMETEDLVELLGIEPEDILLYCWHKVEQHLEDETMDDVVQQHMAMTGEVNG